jgi:hypothetical protein
MISCDYAQTLLYETPPRKVFTMPTHKQDEEFPATHDVLVEGYDSGVLHARCSISGSQLNAFLDEYFGHDEWYFGGHIVYNRNGRAALILRPAD